MRGAFAGLVDFAATVANVLFDRFVIPFEVVSFVLLAALIGGITLARRDNTGAKR